MDNKKEYQRQYYMRNRQKVIDQSVAWKRNNRDRANAYSRSRRKGQSRAAEARDYRKRHPEKSREANRRYRIRHSEELREKRRLMRAKNRDRLNAACKQWHQDNHAYVLEKKRLKRQTDIRYAIETRLRGQLVKAVLRRKTTKTDSTFNLLGCTIDQFVTHLESLFLSGMSWDNRSEWEIDHILPVASFDLTDPAQQKRCFHYSNLRPLWTPLNRQKQDKIISCPDFLVQ